MPYGLRSEVSFCRAGDRLVFLDLSHDRYFCLSPAAEDAFVAWVAAPDADPATVPNLAPLIADGLLTAMTTPATRPAGEPPRVSGTYWGTPAAAPAAAVIEMGARLIVARLAITCLPLRRVIAALRTRKSRCTPSQNQIGTIASTIAALARCGAVISPLDQCLPRSLAVANAMLAGCALPTLVFGVKLGPFEAHAWVQHGTMVVNDSIDHVRRFTPILTI